ncbi:MAG: S8 family serine peptidase [Clostridiales bacterium]|nr:S8 family serine peptidase [Clostridiales bacterium]
MRMDRQWRGWGRGLALLLALLLGCAPMGGLLPPARAQEPAPQGNGYLFRLKEGMAPAHRLMDDRIRSVLPDQQVYLAESVEEILALFGEQAIEYIEPNISYELYGDAPMAGTALLGGLWEDDGEGEAVEPSPQGGGIAQQLSDAPAPASYPNDPQYPSQWYLPAVRAGALWDSGLDGEGVKLAVIDSGLYEAHEDIDSGHILLRQNFKANGDTDPIKDHTGHGTAVTGIVAAQIDNGKHVAGITDRVDLLVLRCFTNPTNGAADELVAAIDKAIEEGADVINMSWGSTTYSETIHLAVQKAHRAGVLLVSSAGNSGTADKSYPASHDEVVSVGGGTLNGDNYVYWSGTHHNDAVFVSAPATNFTLLSTSGGTKPGGNGTSYSAPIVSALGVAAKQVNKQLDNDGFKELLRMSAVDKGGEGRDDYYGYGLVDAEAFVALLSEAFPITYETDGGELPDGDYPTAYTIDRDLGSPLSLPTPTRAGDHFLGWYDNEALEGDPVTEVPDGSVGALTYYAKWFQDGGFEFSSVTVGGHEAQMTSTDALFKVLLPKGTALAAQQVVVQPVHAAVSVGTPTTADGGATWSFTASIGTPPEVSSQTFTITCVVTEVAQPALKQAGAVQARALLPSLDGLGLAQPYSSGPIGGHFSGVDAQTSYEIVEGGRPTVALSGGALVCAPTPDEDGLTLRVGIVAVNAVQSGELSAAFRSPPKYVDIAVGRVPSDVVIHSPAPGTTLEVDCRDAFTHADLRLSLYDNDLTDLLWSPGAKPVRGVDYEVLRAGDIPDNETGYDALRFTRDFLVSRQGKNQLTLKFSDGRTEAAKSAVVNLRVSPFKLTFKKLAGDQTPYAVIENVPLGSTVALPPAPTRESYTFGGWTIGGTGTAFTKDTKVEDSYTLMAKWEPVGGGSVVGGGGGGGVAVEEPLRTPASPQDGSVAVPYELGQGIVRLQLDSRAQADLVSGFAQGAVIDLRSAGATAGAALETAELASLVKRLGDRQGSLCLLFGQGSLTLDRGALDALLLAATGSDLLFDIRPVSLSLSVGSRVTGSMPVFEVSGRSGTSPLASLESPFAVTLRTGRAEAARSVWRLEGAECAEELACAAEGTEVTFETAVFGRYALAYDAPAEVPAGLPFTDVPEDAWYRTELQYCYAQGLISGVGAQEFAPELPLSRAMVVTLLHRMGGAPTGGAFTALDVPQEAWYHAAFSWGVQQGVVSGLGGGHYAPEDEVTREQAAVLLFNSLRADGRPASPSGELAAFADAGRVSDWALEALRWAVGNGILGGRPDGRLDPGGHMTRAEMAAVLYRFATLQAPDA